MLICPKCNIDYEEGKIFCKHCGSKLVTKVEEHTASPLVTKPLSKETTNIYQLKEDLESATPKATLGKTVLKCSNCNLEYEEGNKFCKNCGAPLISEVIGKSTQFEVPPKTIVKPSTIKVKEETLHGEEFKRSVKHEKEVSVCTLRKKDLHLLFKNKRALKKEKEKIEKLLTNLESKRGLVSDEVFSSTKTQHAMQFESLEKSLQNIDAKLMGLKNTLGAEIGQVTNDLEPFKKKLNDVVALYGSGALSKKDFINQKKWFKKNTAQKIAALKSKKKLLKFLNFGLEHQSLYFIRRVLKVCAVVLIVLLIAGGGLGSFLYYKEKMKEIRKVSYSGKSASDIPSDYEQIKKVIENIQKANLDENIELFMSCYSSSFPDYEKKRDDTINLWSKYDFLKLDYTIKEKNVIGDNAFVKLVWNMKFGSKGTQETKELMDNLRVLLKKEGQNWKIVGIEKDF